MLSAFRPPTFVAPDTGDEPNHRIRGRRSSPVASRRDGCADRDRDCSLSRRGAGATGGTYARVVHAPGRTIAARVPRRARRGVDPRCDQTPGRGGGDHAAAGPAVRRRRGRAVQRHRRAGPRRRVRHRRRARHRSRRRATAALAGPISTGSARSPSTTSTTWSTPSGCSPRNCPPTYRCWPSPERRSPSPAT